MIVVCVVKESSTSLVMVGNGKEGHIEEILGGKNENLNPSFCLPVQCRVKELVVLNGERLCGGNLCGESDCY